MIYTFKSRAAADVILRPELLRLRQCKTAVEVHEKAETLRAKDPSQHVEVEGDSVRLRDRAAPFIELLTQSAMAGKDVLWGV